MVISAYYCFLGYIKKLLAIFCVVRNEIRSFWRGRNGVRGYDYFISAVLGGSPLKINLKKMGMKENAWGLVPHDVHLMLDFETFSLDTQRAGIMAVAVVPFYMDPNEKVECPPLLVWASMESNYFLNRDMSGSQEWWCSQDRTAAQCVYLDQVKKGNTVTVRELFNRLHIYLQSFWLAAVPTASDVYVWTRGCFDVQILQELYKTFNRECPIPFYRFRDARTFISGHYVPEAQFLRHGEPLHCPDVDCRKDVRAIQYIHAKLNECGFYKAVNAVSPEVNRERLKECTVMGRVKLSNEE
jgi:hypothetical protein